MNRSAQIRRFRFTHGLRFRLTLSYVLFFAVLLSFIGLFFSKTLRTIYDRQERQLLEEEWAAVKGYLRIEKGKHDWYYDRNDPDEALIVDRMRRVLLLTDANGRVLEVSPAYAELGVEKPAEIRAMLRAQQPVWMVKHNEQKTAYVVRSGTLIDDSNQRYYVAIGRSMAQGNALVEQFVWNYFLVLPLMLVTGSVFGWLMAGRALRPIDELARTAQRITGANLSSQIPERGSGDEIDRLIGSFNRMVERLNASFTQTRQFSTDVSHELRTPLTAIRGQLEVALFSAKTVEHYREAMLNALEDVERLSQTIRALLLLSQAESGQLVLQKQTLDLAAVAADIVDQFQIPAEEAQLTVSAELPAECRIDADRIQIERLLSNLLSNAVKYTPRGGRVRVLAKCEGAHATLVVEDTGEGIPEGHLPHIFDRFYRVRADRNPDRGLGLGLSFVAWIVKAHGGTVDVESRVGQGTRFTVRLPVGSVERPEPVPAYGSL